jgi:hypothetical protein
MHEDHADVAQLAERISRKDEVPGSSPGVGFYRTATQTATFAAIPSAEGRAGQRAAVYATSW